MDKQNEVHPYTGILFSHQKEWSTDMCYYLHEPWKRYAKWKKPVTEDHILHDSIYIKCLEQANPQRLKVD